MAMWPGARTVAKLALVPAGAKAGWWRIARPWVKTSSSSKARRRDEGDDVGHAGVDEMQAASSPGTVAPVSSLRSLGSDIAMRTFSPTISAARVPAMVSKVTRSGISSPRWAVKRPKQRAPLPHISASPPSAL
jgi:hypothetical protein